MQKTYSTAEAECMCKILKKEKKNVEWNFSNLEISIILFII